MNRTKGLTLIEILITLSILGIITAIVLSSISSQVSHYTLQKTSSGFTSLLEKARSRSINSYNDTKHSVRIESSQAILFEGTSYSSSNSSNEVFAYDRGILIANTSLNGGGSTITFDKVTGATSQYGSITFAIASASTSSSTIYISQAGVIYSQ